MKKINFNYSLKSIPTPTKTSYQLMLMEKIESVIKQMLWKAHFHLKKDTSNIGYANYGFKTRNYSLQCKELQNFEKDLLDTIKLIKFRIVKDNFQRKLKEDILNIKSSPDVYAFADKTTNIYKLPPQDYKKLLHENITKSYKKSPTRLEKSINLEAKEIAAGVKLDHRIEYMAKAPAYITLKDHKDNFRSAHPCRLINPCKSEIGKISKSILENINRNLLKLLQVNQWRNSESVIKWFYSIENKSQCKFIQLDIAEFYPSISEEILDNAILFAQQYIHIPEKDLRIIKHCRKSLLYNNNEPWKKKNTESCFDVTMGSFDGAEICELVGIHILSLLSNKLDKQSTGLYRDDGLVLLRNTSKQKTDRIRKDIIEIFKNAGFKIEIKTNLHIVDFLDVTFNLLDGTYKPYKKPNDQLLYVNTSSNHPPQIIKQLPISISNRLSNNSSNKQVFDMSKGEYEKALRESGYKNVSLIYTDKKDIKQKRNRSRNIIWFNPPFNKNVSTNVAKRFLNLLDQHFPKSNKLHAIFNRNTVKVSYSCTQNMSSMIKSHNKKVINKDIKELKSCNCSLKSKCPLTCQCQVTDIYINALYYHQTNQIKCISELLRVIPKSDFIIIGSRLTTKVVQTMPHFQNIFGN